ncbi:hypothetical protein [Bacterioplanoides pacificum]|uniref:Uncharacterized protein n=1 Tax=Bacterioplanoides pacificum TaxID=1171596 RepID=A0ABV7VNN9_9GAMM
MSSADGLWHITAGAADFNQLRLVVSEALATDDAASAAFQLGYASATPSVAFFFAYQLAVRQLDSELANDQFAAFAASEKGVRSSRDFSTAAQQREDGSWRICGQKSHVMLLPQQALDFIYVLANDAQQHLCCFKVAASAAGVEAIEANKPQSFVVDIPHTPVVFNNVSCETGYVRDRAHQTCFKPFRYWEDVMVGLAMSGWMTRHSGHEQMAEVVASLQQCYRRQPDYYCAEVFGLLDKLLAQLDEVAALLPAEQRQVWQRDRLLLQLGSAARQAAAAKFTV